MIRSNVPMPLLFRLRMRANLVARRAQAGILAHRWRSGVEAERAIWSGQGERRRNEKRPPEMWAEFIDRYERFTNALCSAAKDGCNDVIEQEYAGARWWFATHYRKVAPRVRPYLDVEFSGESGLSRVSEIADYIGNRREQDVIEALFRASSMRALLQNDNGDLIPRIGRISDAVYRCNASFETE
jgi:hypothetical protein